MPLDFITGGQLVTFLLIIKIFAVGCTMNQAAGLSLDVLTAKFFFKYYASPIFFESQEKRGDKTER